MRKRRFGQQVVGQPVGKPGQRIRGERRHDEHVCALQMWVRDVVLRLACESEERLNRNESLRTCRDEWIDVVLGSDE
jgi:hypothetical protein